MSKTETKLAKALSGLILTEYESGHIEYMADDSHGRLVYQKRLNYAIKILNLYKRNKKMVKK